jgi:putative serine protease PepD
VSQYDDRDPDGPWRKPQPEADPSPSSDPEHLGAEHDSEPEPHSDPQPEYLGDLEDTEDTRPIWAAPEPPQPERSAPAVEPQPHPTAPYPIPGYDPRAPQAYPTYPAPQSATGRMPGWVWPVVAAMALVVGLLGGTLGGVAVSRSLAGTSSEGFRIPVIETERGPAPPLEADNGSIAAVAQELLPSTVQVLAGSRGDGATGSGFVFDGKGHIITNNHVVADFADAGDIAVTDNAGREYEASIVGRSEVYDIAVLAVDGAEDLPAAALGSSQAMRVGESVVAIGSPLGLSSTVTSGIVSAVDRPVTTGSVAGAEVDASYINAVQTDAAINPGNSGGPLVNMRGEVIGVNSAIATMGGFGGEAGNIGVGFAIPMEQVRITAAQILATGEAKYPVIGAKVRTGGRDGARIVSVNAGTPADRAGLQEGDTVVGIEGKQVHDGIGLIVAIRTYQPGQEVTLTVRRDGDERTVDITLDAQVG